MYRRKKIGFFISHIYGDYQTRLCNGVLQKASEYGYLVEIFASNDGEDLGDYGLGEKSILEIPKSGDFDGFIFASGTYLLPSLEREIRDLLSHELHCPVIDINQKDSCFPRVILENNSPIKDLVCHLHQVHGYNKIFYLGNTTEPYFNEQRIHYFLKGLEQFALPSENRIFSCDGTKEDISHVLDDILSGSPQAIVCYNDFLALDVISELQNRGKHIPEDMAVTGADTLEFGQRTDPVLTSVTFPIDKLGEKAVELLSAAFHGETLPAVSEIQALPSLGATCGCPSRICSADTYTYTGELNRRLESNKAELIQNMHMSANLQGVADLDQGMDLIEGFVNKLPHCKEFYLCLYDDWDRPSGKIRQLTGAMHEDYDIETVLMKLAVKNGKRLPECTFTRHTTLPDYLYGNDTSHMIYSSLFFGEQCFGYLALSFDKDIIGYDFSFLSWLMNVNNMLKNLRDKKNLGLLAERLEEIYTKDELTGLMNRQGFKQTSAVLFEKAITDREPLCAIMLDLDGLKQINDTYGHAEGDFAIQVLAHALENSVEPPAVCMRQGGDEFQILAPGYDDRKAVRLLSEIQKYLDNYNRLHTKKYIIQASSGYCIRIPSHISDLSEMFEEADKAMYEVKKSKDKHIIKE